MKCQSLFSRKKYENVSKCLLKQNSTYNILKYFSYFTQKTTICLFFGGAGMCVCVGTGGGGGKYKISIACGISPENEKGYGALMS